MSARCVVWRSCSVRPDTAPGGYGLTHRDRLLLALIDGNTLTAHLRHLGTHLLLNTQSVSQCTNYYWVSIIILPSLFYTGASPPSYTAALYCRRPRTGPRTQSRTSPPAPGCTSTPELYKYQLNQIPGSR